MTREVGGRRRSRAVTGPVAAAFLLLGALIDGDPGNIEARACADRETRQAWLIEDGVVEAGRCRSCPAGRGTAPRP